MKILMIAPHVFFSQRGTPYSAYLKLKALSESGIEFDLATYPFGENVEIKGVAIYRSSRPFFIKNIKQGPSLKKLLLDFFLAIKIISLLRKKRYDFLYTHEEMGFFGVLLKKFIKIRLVHEMHSSLPVEIEERKFSSSKLIVNIFRNLEKMIINNSDIIVVHCKNLVDIVGNINQKVNLVLVENYSNVKIKKVGKKKQNALRKELGIKKGEPVILYTGSFANVNNLPMLLESAKIVEKTIPNVKFVLVGGETGNIEMLKDLSGKLNIAENVRIVEKVSPEELNSYFSIATILVSPRYSGINIPFKIFSYLESGVPIVVPESILYNSFLDSGCAMITKPDKEDFANGVVRLIKDKKLMQKISKGAIIKSKQYSYKNYISNIKVLKQKICGLEYGKK
ncbi:MAG: glycosyltransferase family 4 protein [archaeon]